MDLIKGELPITIRVKTKPGLAGEKQDEQKKIGTPDQNTAIPVEITDPSVYQRSIIDSGWQIRRRPDQVV